MPSTAKRDERGVKFFTEPVEDAIGLVQRWSSKLESIDGNFIEKLNTRHFIIIMSLILAISLTNALLGYKISCTGFTPADADDQLPKCDCDDESIFHRKRFVQDYCWSQGLFTNRFGYDLPADSLPAPGIVPCVRIEDNYLCSEEEQRKQKVYHLWYQWVNFYFSLTIAAFYLPHMFIEGHTRLGKLRLFMKEKFVWEWRPNHDNDNNHDNDDNDNNDVQKVFIYTSLTYWLKAHLTTRFGHKRWEEYKVPFGILLARTAFFLVSLTHLLLSAKMFPIGNYYKLGILWHVPSTDNYTHIGDVLFPKMAGCLVKMYSPSGLTSVAGMCNIAPNVVFQYLFLIVWWCVVILIVLNFLNVLRAIIEFRAVSYRNTEISLSTATDEDLRHRYDGARAQDMALIYNYCDLGSQIILDRVVQNIRAVIVTFAFKDLADYIRQKREKDDKLDAFLAVRENENRSITEAN